MSDMNLKHDAWVVVMDGEKALFLRNEGDEKFVNLRVFREFEQENPPTHDQGTARPGRRYDAGPGHKSAVEETDWHRLGKERFADEIAERLYVAAHAGKYDQLVLAAPPQVLGALRKQLHKAVRDRVAAEIDKDLTSHPVDRIEKILLGS